MPALWTERFFPHSFSEFVGNAEIVEFARKWANSWNDGKRQQPLLFFGATGTGKTCLSHLLAELNDWQLFELNASDFRSKDVIERVAASAVQGASFSGRKRLVLLDEVDGLHSVDRGGAAAIARILKEAKNPVILTANNIYSKQQLAGIRAACKLLRFRKINFLSIAKRLREILEEEKIAFDAEAVKALAQNCNGDMRSALLDLQTLAISGEISLDSVGFLGYRERQQDIFKTIGAIFKAKTFDEARKARFQSDVSDDLLFRWIEENIPRHFTETQDTASAFNQLSKADVFEGRIRRRQNYGFRRYSSELLSAGVSLSRSNDYHGWVSYQFPSLLRKLSSSKGVRSMKKELGAKIGEKIHSSSREVISYDLPYLKAIFSNKEKAIQLTTAFDLNEKELAFLLETKPETKKVKTIIEKAGQLRKKSIAGKRKPLGALQEAELKQFEETKPEEKEEPVAKHEGDGSQTTLS